MNRNDIIKLKILDQLYNAKEMSLTIGRLSRQIGCNNDSVKNACEFLEILDMIEIITAGADKYPTRTVRIINRDKVRDVLTEGRLYIKN